MSDFDEEENVVSLVRSDGDAADGLMDSSSPLIQDVEPVELITEKTSSLSTFFIFFKSYLGSGILGMAAAYRQGG